MKKILLPIILPSLISLGAQATDLEVYVGGADNIETNVMLLLDDSGSMGTAFGTGTRWTITRDIIQRVVSSLKDIRVGLAVFNGSATYNGSASRIIVPIENIEKEIDYNGGKVAVKDVISRELNRLGPGGGTPLSLSAEDVYWYLAGKERDKSGNAIAKPRNSPITHECQNTKITLFTDGAPSNYANTIQSTVLNKLATSAEKTYTHEMELPGVTGKTTQSMTLTKSCGAASTCLDDLGAYMGRFMAEVKNDEKFNLEPGQKKLLNKYDATDPKKSRGVITVSTIGAGARTTFVDAANNPTNPTGQLMISTAAGGRGEFFLADDPVKLEEALKSSLAGEPISNQSLVPPSISASSFNPLALSEDVFLPVFEPTTDGSINWIGNLKKFKYSVTDGIQKIVGHNNIPLYKENAAGEIERDAEGNISLSATVSDLWGQAAGGPEVAKGGARDKLLNNASRTIMTVVPTSNTDKKIQNKPLVPIDNGSVKNEVFARVHAGVTIGDSNQKEVVPQNKNFKDQGTAYQDFIDWVKTGKKKSSGGTTTGTGTGTGGGTPPVNGVDILGAPIHSSPVTLTDTDGKPTIIVMGTDRGVLHFFDAKTGEEKMAFIPPEMFAGLHKYYDGGSNVDSKPMGMDGFISVITNKESPRRVTLFIGTRRGSDVYYLLDLALNNDGSLGTGHKVTILDEHLDKLYGKFGQTWARPIAYRATKPFDEDKSKVIGFVSGGYDPKQDNYEDYKLNDKSDPDSVGNFVAVIDLDKPGTDSYGKPIWYASSKSIPGASGTFEKLTGMTHSIVSEPAIADFDNDGLHDKFFVVDINGKAFRFDMDVSQSSVKTIVEKTEGVMVADLTDFQSKESANNISRRRFYERPDVFLGSVPRTKDGGSVKVIKMAFGSGYRAHPLKLGTQKGKKGYHIEDKFYILVLDNPFSKPDTTTTATVIKENLLIDAVKEKALTYWKNDTGATGNQANQKTYDKKIREGLAVFDGNTKNTSRKYGIFLDLFGGPDGDDGEKLITRPTTAGNQILFTTYVPPAIESDKCVLNLGRSYLYAFDAANFIPDPFWSLGAPQPANEKLSKDFDADKGRYPLPFPGLGSSAVHTGTDVTSTGQMLQTANIGGVAIYRDPSKDPKNPGINPNDMLYRLYWQEMVE